MRTSKTMSFLTACSTNPYLTAIREGMTLALPVIVAGTFAILLNNFPFEPYQQFMRALFGENWTMFGSFIYNGTFGVLAITMALSVGHSLGEDYNRRNPLDKLTSSIFAFVTFSSVMCTMEPVAAGSAFEIRWLGVHGLLLTIITSACACYIFRFLLRFSGLRIRILSNSNNVSINQALGTMFPAVLTISFFAGYRVVGYLFGISNPNESLYMFLYDTFSSLGGQTLSTANIYGFSRHLLWFLGIHGSNVLEPVMEELYVTAQSANVELKSLGVTDPRQVVSSLNFFKEIASPYAVFTKPFFDCFTSIGGAGSTLGLLIACLIGHKDTSARKVARISVLPSLFNINEILLFGIPVVLNPIFFLPFIIIPFVTTTVSYYFVIVGLLPATTQTVVWNIPVFINSYMATGSIAGPLVQLFNLCLATLIYLPFVLIDNELQTRNFATNFQQLIALAVDGNTFDKRQKLTDLPNPLGGLAANLALDMRRGMKKKEFYMVYQPQVNSDSGLVVGVESLMRWRHPQIGFIPPPVFVGIAEDTGLIHALGDWSTEESIRQISVWRKHGLTDITISINVSAIQLGEKRFPERLGELLAKYSVPKESIILEVTESIAFTSEVVQSDVLLKLHALGMRLAIDDFGMGHTSLVYLKRFPVACLKVDAMLSKDVMSSRSSAEIISSIAELCRTLNIKMLVEYIDDEAHLMKLRSLGCSIVQGYFYSKPLSPGVCMRFIKEKHKSYG